jgi:4,4'-diaponeurosporenoate glycosyltransferase
MVPLAGRGILHMRMFPEGFGQMTESWSKAFVQGAKDSSPVVVALSILWISALWSCTMLLAGPRNYGRTALAAIYLVLGLQLYWQARQIGAYRLATCLLYPIPLAYYCLVFGRSIARRAIGRRSSWKGREV